MQFVGQEQDEQIQSRDEVYFVDRVCVFLHFVFCQMEYFSNWSIMKIKSTKQFWWRLNHLKRNGGEITVTDRTPEMDVKDFNRIELLVSKRVRWEIGSEGMTVWNACGYKDIPTLAKAYGIK